MRYVMGLYGCLVLFVAINMDIANYFDVYWSQWWKAELATYSIVWILFAVAIVIWGFVTKSLFYRAVGLLAFVPILLKVFLIDLSPTRSVDPRSRYVCLRDRTFEHLVSLSADCRPRFGVVPPDSRHQATPSDTKRHQATPSDTKLSHTKPRSPTVVQGLWK